MLIMELHRSIIWFICCIFCIIIWFICACVGVACAWVRVVLDTEGVADWLWLRAMVEVVTWSELCAIAGIAVSPNSARPATAELITVLVRVVILIANLQSVVNRLVSW